MNANAPNVERRPPTGGTLAAELPRQRDGALLRRAFSLAVLLHLLVLMLNFPELRSPVRTSTERPNVIVVRKYVPPPPRIERRRIVRQEFTRRIPVPDPTPDQPEPIREPIEPVLPDYPDDVEFLIGDPGPPPQSGGEQGPPSEPLIAGVGGATLPVRIEESYVQPEYPEIARRARAEGRVVLQAVIRRDGSVDHPAVLVCSQPGFGFENSAIVAVRQWRYVPATQQGRPVDVYFTILVDFELVGGGGPASG